MDLKTYIATSSRGTAAKLAKALRVSPSYLSQMAHGVAPISPERCVEIERETDGVVRRRELRLDDWRLIWPELDPDSREFRALGASDDTQPPDGKPHRVSSSEANRTGACTP
ncbi:transcriptional regulator [Pararobbsia silviterrae]|uniref:HTH cro/C1-type domain-containing protein n=1 Tax=Pararobbsia silviterrae TaxID=1792498 RepID=A0A494X7I6_9BURK|nr:YdaS family helix-turn-helix protein [Pararobbsia silviterrae]RKP46667.1 hypothetical protein D7S86_24570 [Pararobbsia silviterrae]